MTRALPSWNDGPAREAILRFVASVCEGPDALPEEERIAVFDNDGTLWVEKPVPTQLHFVIDQWRAEVEADPSLKEREPYRAAVDRDDAWFRRAIEHHHAGDDHDMDLVMDAILSTVSDRRVDEYHAEAMEFYRRERHPALDRPYERTVYQPMHELLRHLEDHGFTCYLVSGGDRDLMRPISAEYYGIPIDQVIGSAVGVEYDADANELRYGGRFEIIDDGTQKPVRIYANVGRRPILAAGNSDGDLPMLRYTTRSPRSLGLLIHHDDDGARGDEAYDIGAERALREADEHGLVVVSVKDDWSEVLPDTDAETETEPGERPSPQQTPSGAP
ncbi:phosphoserine phosphatase [Agromyces flavus]|uniref:Phosphoserine phosphatase n=1 Tax=Agromyces flavus TaxID=589382 RepID=A0A1H1ZDU4_9MICO|nr:HAD family hydrolase [Agromyces flavus]MCP2367028.1 phosphoserine phosphatase [Agromyces flavus]GGI46544.1 acid phosphatase [Agromyces flavus]SDT31386.1 Phosphoserine phosphatase [Agromyces flavus]